MMIREMTHNECVTMVAEHHMARLACAKNDVPYVVPIHYAHSGSRLYAFSMPGKKLDILRANPRACVLIEVFEDKHRWKSVVVDAVFHELSDTEELHNERLKAWSLLSDDLDWWEPGALKPRPQPTVAVSPHVFFALEIETLSGREAKGDTS
ncbi:MAG TPA: pyridoxamine 5'-phosphate oxidase family protein [Pararhizobium sp.]|uniref:pyridoxamine 5'-phosphate oxidase family protein n=1 Tax=Pararhizobium sp. TaxID=1977563 RepID=UPI002C5EAE76|nr:pyridoxamine 5'-phosphate oxidase family protein [Pararhizobium sp.]HTO33096.1 pyridoxamine 5'-phosphate oxidase family protein [Pararhizobium sp.]